MADEVTITPRKNGPYLMSGPTRLTAPEGREIPHPGRLARGRCAHSGYKPSCDGTHGAIGVDGTLAN